MAKKKLQAMNGNIHLADIDPDVHGKYSKNLFLFLKKSQGVFHLMQVYSDRDGVLYIGWLDGSDEEGIWFTGTRLIAVLCNGSRERMLAYSPGDVKRMRLTVFPEFWEKYKAIGRCTIDQHHSMWFIDEAVSRWDPANPGVCQWCGQSVLKRAG